MYNPAGAKCGPGRSTTFAAFVPATTAGLRRLLGGWPASLMAGSRWSPMDGRARPQWTATHLTPANGPKWAGPQHHSPSSPSLRHPPPPSVRSLTPPPVRPGAVRPSPNFASSLSCTLRPPTLCLCLCLCLALSLSQSHPPTHPPTLPRGRAFLSPSLALPCRANGRGMVKQGAGQRLRLPGIRVIESPGDRRWSARGGRAARGCRPGPPRAAARAGRYPPPRCATIG